MEKLFNFGAAMDLLLGGEATKISRMAWGGYWSIEEIPGLTGKVIVAHLKDGVSKVPAQPYQSDMLAQDWYILKWAD